MRVIKLNRIFLGLFAIAGSASAAHAEPWSIEAPVMQDKYLEQLIAPVDFQLLSTDSTTVAIAPPSATETIDALFFGTIDELCAQGEYDTACLKLLDLYQESYEIAVGIDSLDPQINSGDDTVDALEPSIAAIVEIVKNGALGKAGEEGLNEKIKQLIELGVDGAKKAEALILKLAGDEKKIILKSLNAVVKSLQAELKKSTDDDEKKALQAQIDLAKKLIAAIEKGAAKKDEKKE